jgi:hypothetical protein
MTHPQVLGQLANAMEPDEGKEPQKVQKRGDAPIAGKSLPFPKKDSLPLYWPIPPSHFLYFFMYNLTTPKG